MRLASDPARLFPRALEGPLAGLDFIFKTREWIVRRKRVDLRG